MFSSTDTFESQIYPGVMVTLKRVGVAFRRRVELELSENGLRKRLVRAEYLTLNPENKPVSEFPMETQTALIKLDHEYGNLVEEERLKWIFSVVEKITVPPEAKEVEIAGLLEYAPEDFIGEINVHVERMKGLTVEQTKNS